MREKNKNIVVNQTLTFSMKGGLKLLRHESPFRDVRNPSMSSVKLKVIPIHICAVGPALKRHNSLFLYSSPQQDILYKQTQIETENIL